MNGLQSRNGEKFMEQNSLHEQQELLEAQIRECFGRVTYSHKTHEKCTDILLSSNACIKLWQMILSAVTTGTFLATVIWDGKIAAVIGTILSTVLLVLNAYTKKYDLAGLAEKHKTAASSLWDIRESYLSLLADFRFMPVGDVITKRDELQKKLGNIYKGCPRTNSKAYEAAQKALKENEELTFSDEEIDKLLPTRIRKLQ